MQREMTPSETRHPPAPLSLSAASWEERHLLETLETTRTKEAVSCKTVFNTQSSLLFLNEQYL